MPCRYRPQKLFEDSFTALTGRGAIFTAGLFERSMTHDIPMFRFPFCGIIDGAYYFSSDNKKKDDKIKKAGGER
jgi:hypothetical protein